MLSSIDIYSMLSCDNILNSFIRVNQKVSFLSSNSVLRRGPDIKENKFTNVLLCVTQGFTDLGLKVAILSFLPELKI